MSACLVSLDPPTFWVKSRGTKGLLHEVTAVPDGGFCCTCRGFSFRLDCSHVREIAALKEEED